MLKPDNIYNWNGVVVNEFLLTKHNDNGIDLPSGEIKVESITIHNTPDLVNVYDDAEQYTRATYNGNMGDVVVTMYVDDVNGWLNMPLNSPTYHSATTKGNYSSISIECIMDGQTGETNEKAEDNCARITAYLLNKFNLDISCVTTHKRWNGKNCPIYILPHWDKFIERVKGHLCTSAVVEKLYRIRTAWDNPKSQIGAYKNLNSAIELAKANQGYYVYDETGLQVYPEIKLDACVSVDLPTLRKDSKGTEVKAVQSILSVGGYNIGTCGVDGILGNNTVDAIKKFQMNNKLVTDGVVGIATWTKLLRGGN